MGHIIHTNTHTKSVTCECGGRWKMIGNWKKNVLNHAVFFV